MSTPNPFVERLIAVRTEAIQLLHDFDLWDKGWRFQFSNQINTVGVCNHDNRTIHYSQKFVLKSTPESITDTLLHEIAHALVGRGQGHGVNWQRQAIAIGANPYAKCQGGSVTSAKYKYSIECPNEYCNWKVYRYRMKERNHGARCPNCGTEVEIFELKY